MMQIQVALDRLPLDRAIAIASSIAPWVDGIEVGTSLVKEHGMSAVREVADAVAATTNGPWVHADLKTVDDAVTEVTAALAAGATSVSVLALASDTTIRAAIRTADERSAEVVLDLMLTDNSRRSELARWLPPHIRLGAHVGKDDQAGGTSVLDMLGDWATGRRLAVAGGLGLDHVPALRTIPDLRLVVGSAVTGASDPSGVARALDEARRLPAAVHPGPDVR
ncbi:orotidine 5'-phosphate decarboxylase / HUMPS family protein [Pengzhenrongella sicca]|uniref:Orotidine 5'-phosphate decarboxylase n=1 Tax=Pengzhenrongella sicca TaxID=2819238 RepID=A0A8A4ZAM8_9MICO|nr:orotidine 5'-phosphate decarboxylase / HUMPS family protein [Pengzhenrongella sicca]QTE28079.1 orotidine 5'-phosphate decarboxylase [Pengzhenrongella sicca]